MRIDTASRVVHAPPQSLYRALLDPEALATWLPPKGMTARIHRFEPFEGGTFRIVLTYDDASRATPGKTSERTDVVQGRYLTLLPSERVVQLLAFESEDPAFAGEMTMTWSLVDVPGGTEVTIAAENVPVGITPEDHHEGMRSTLENLAAYAEAEEPLVPADFEVPLGLDTPHFRLRPLTPAVVDLDYEALMSSIDHLNAMFGREWPHAHFTLEENLQDLVEHQQEFEQRAAFAYTVLSSDETTCLGCVYINPPRGASVDARVHMWVRQSAHDRGLDPMLFHAVRAWIDERWPFANVSYPGRNEDGSWEPLEGEST